MQLKNKTELCIGEGITFTGNISGNWSQEKTLNNYGVFTPSNPNVNSLANVSFTNYGTVNANFNFNQGDAKAFHNYAILNTSTNTFRSGSIFNYAGGEINISGSAVFGSSILFLNEGEINVNQNLEFDASLNLSGNYIVGGNTTYNAFNIYLENANFDITGNVNIWSQVHLQTNTNNQCSEIYFNSINQWHGLITSNHGNLSMTSFPNTQNVSGNVSSDSCSSSADPSLPTTTWLGNNKHFHQEFNWSNGLPTANKNVVIPETNKDPELTSGNFSLHHLVIENNASLKVTNEVQLDIKGDIAADGIFDAEEASLLFSNTEKNQNITANNLFNVLSIHINSGKEILVNGSHQVNIHYLLELENNSTLQTNNKLTLKCKFLGNNPTIESYQVGQVAETFGTIIVKVTVEHCYTGRRAFRMLGSSVDTDGSIRENWQENASAFNHDPNPGYGTHITGVGNNPDTYNGFDWQPSGNPSMFQFNNIEQEWSAVQSTLINLEAGQAYRLMVRGDRSVDVTNNSAAPKRTKLRSFGALHQGDKQITNLSSVSEKFNLVANPYQSVVDLVKVYQDTQNVMPYFIIWDPTLGSRGAFAYINLITLEKSNNQSEISRFLLPHQAGYFVTQNNGIAQITFKESHKNPSKTVPVVLSQDTKPFIHAKVFSEALYNANEKPSDGLHISFVENGNDNLDEADALKMNNLDENLARFHQGKLVSIEERSIPNSYTELPLYIDTYTSNSYVFEIETGHLENYNVYLKDNYTQEEISLVDGINTVEVEVNPSINASIAFNRFSLILNPISLSTIERSITDFAIYPNPLPGNSLQINTKDLAGENAEISFYNSLGAKVESIKQDFNANGNINIDNLSLQTGVYIVKVQTQSGNNFTTKLIKK